MLCSMLRVNELRLATYIVGGGVVDDKLTSLLDLVGFKDAIKSRRRGGKDAGVSSPSDR